MGPSQGTGYPLFKYLAHDLGDIEENEINTYNPPCFDNVLRVVMKTQKFSWDDLINQETPLRVQAPSTLVQALSKEPCGKRSKV